MTRPRPIRAACRTCGKDGGPFASVVAAFTSLRALGWSYGYGPPRTFRCPPCRRSSGPKGRNEAIWRRHAIVDLLNERIPKIASVIHREVSQDWGPIALRTINRDLAVLEGYGAAKRVPLDAPLNLGWLRSGKYPETTLDEQIEAYLEARRWRTTVEIANHLGIAPITARRRLMKLWRFRAVKYRGHSPRKWRLRDA